MKRGRGWMLLSKALDNNVNDQDRTHLSHTTSSHSDNLPVENNTGLDGNSSNLNNILPDLSMCDVGFNSDRLIQDYLTGENNPECSFATCISESMAVLENPVEFQCGTLDDEHSSILSTSDNIPQVIQTTSYLLPLSNCCSPSDNDFDSDDSVRDRDYIPLTQNRRNISESSSDSDIIPDSQPLNVRISESPELERSAEQSEQTNQNDFRVNQDHLTKKGTIRKRKFHDIPLSDRKIIRKQLKATSIYSLKPGCAESCKKKCSSKISDASRLQLNQHFRAMTWVEQRYFIRHNTAQTNPKRRTNTTDKKITRSTSISYFLLNENREKINVCKIFFLTTLGFNKKNDKAVRNALKDNLTLKPTDKRGLNPNPTKKNNDAIIAHINSYNPSISHYRREHAPNRRYLPSDLNIRGMHNDFCEKNGITEETSKVDYITYEHYRGVIKSLNISFAKLGHEECEICEIYKIHNPVSDIRHRNCTDCKEFENHHRRYILARQKYEEDKNRQIINNLNPECDTVYYSVDLEKIIMLPRMNEFKVVIFCPRLILFNESFVPLGDKKSNGSKDTFACIWHEGISGRKKEDIISCFRAFFTQYRDLKHIVLWLDNCAAQNKNWGLFTYMVHLVNSKEVNFDTITLKYLEVGHTYMSADEFHHQVELSLKRKKRLYDFEDFHAAVTDTNRKITVKKMDIGDFCTLEDCSSAYKLQNSSPRAYLNNMCEVSFQRGRNTLSYKNDFENPETELDFLRVKNVKFGIPKPIPKTEFRGITQERKSVIINKLVPLMPETRRDFWHNLHVNKNAVNLINEYDD